MLALILQVLVCHCVWSVKQLSCCEGKELDQYGGHRSVSTSSMEKYHCRRSLAWRRGGTVKLWHSKFSSRSKVQKDVQVSNYCETMKRIVHYNCRVLAVQWQRSSLWCYMINTWTPHNENTHCLHKQLTGI